MKACVEVSPTTAIRKWSKSHSCGIHAGNHVHDCRAISASSNARYCGGFFEVWGVARHQHFANNVIHVDQFSLWFALAVLLRDEASRYSIAMRTELAPELPKIMTDRVQLQQVFMNLMLNAIEAMKETAGELIIRSEVSDHGQLLISVSDTGVGLPPDKPEKTFDAFFTTKSQGTRMGLAITRSHHRSAPRSLVGKREPRRGHDFSLYSPWRSDRVINFGRLASTCARASVKTIGMARLLLSVDRKPPNKDSFIWFFQEAKVIPHRDGTVPPSRPSIGRTKIRSGI